MLRVADDGPGTPAATRADAYESGVANGDGGTVIGLDTVVEIVEAHGWQVAVTGSEAGGASVETTGASFDAAERCRVGGGPKPTGSEPAGSVRDDGLFGRRTRAQAPMTSRVTYVFVWWTNRVICPSSKS